LIYSAYSFMCYWSGPYPEGTHHRAISDGVDLMLRMTNKLLGSAGVKQGPALPDSQDADLKPEDEEKRYGSWRVIVNIRWVVSGHSFLM
jgi:hypothetical protein